MKKDLTYIGTEKNVYTTLNPTEVIIEYNDYLTAFNGLKKAKIEGKGAVINEICSFIFEKLNENGVKTHFIKKLNETDQLCHKVNILPLKFIKRYTSSGTLVKRIGISEGVVLNTPVYEIMLHKENNDFLINESHVVNLGLLTYEELDYIRKTIDKVSQILKNIYTKANIVIVDFKLEFGRNSENCLLVADEISPNTSRLWDKDSSLCFDKDRFRKDQGEILEHYHKLLKRIKLC